MLRAILQGAEVPSRPARGPEKPNELYFFKVEEVQLQAIIVKENRALF
jgi:hypothetical protein